MNQSSDEPPFLHVSTREKTFRREFYREREQILEECLLRMKAGETAYRERDVSASLNNLMAHDLIEEAIAEDLDGINYRIMHIIQLRHIQAALEANADISKVRPSGLPKARADGL